MDPDLKGLLHDPLVDERTHRYRRWLLVLLTWARLGLIAGLSHPQAPILDRRISMELQVQGGVIGAAIDVERPPGSGYGESDERPAWTDRSE